MAITPGNAAPRLLDEVVIVCCSELGRTPKFNGAMGRDHWPYCYTGVVAGAGTHRGLVYGESVQTGSAPLRDPVHPGQLLASIYHSIGINPQSIVYNHLNQPRELVKAEHVPALFA